MESAKDTNDPLLQQIGSIGKWQVITFIVLSLFTMPVAWQMLVVLFQSPSGVDYWCRRPAPFANWSVEQWRNYSTPYTTDKSGARRWDKCHVFALDYSSLPVDAARPPATTETVPCPKQARVDGRWEFDHSFFDWTIQEHFGLVCEYDYLLAPVKSSYMGGVMLGAVLGGLASDRFGRRPTILAMLGAMVLLSLLVALSGSVMVFMVLRFMVAMAVVSEYIAIFVFNMEMVGGRWRIVMGLLFQLPFSLGFMTLAGMGYLLTNWQHLQVAISVPVVVFFFYYWAVPESPRWLLAAGKVERASALIESIADINGRQFDPDKQLVPPHEERGHVSVWELMRFPTVRYRTLNLWFNWMTNVLVYYGLIFSFVDVGGDMYLSTLLGGLVELPAYLVSIGVCLLLGRRLPIAGMMILTGCFLLATIAVPPGEYYRDWPLLLLTLLARFSITASFGILYVYSAEVLPTVLRNTGVSSSSTCGRVGAILAPFVGELTGHYLHLPAIVLAAASIAGGLLILLMPETAGEKLPDTLTEADQLGSTSKPPTGRAARFTNPAPSSKTTVPAEPYTNAAFQDGTDVARDDKDTQL